MEQVSTFARAAIENLLNVHALANMHRSSLDRYYLITAAEWLPRLEENIASIKRELEAQGIDTPESSKEKL